jgi:hypothetical protein
MIQRKSNWAVKTPPDLPLDVQTRGGIESTACYLVLGLRRREARRRTKFGSRWKTMAITHMHTKTREIHLHTRANGFSIAEISIINHFSSSRKEKKAMNLGSKVEEANTSISITVGRPWAFPEDCMPIGEGASHVTEGHGGTDPQSRPGAARPPWRQRRTEISSLPRWFADAGNQSVVCMFRNLTLN